MAASVCEPTRAKPSPSAAASAASHFAFDGLSIDFSIERSASCVPTTIRSYEDSQTLREGSHGSSDAGAALPCMFHVPTHSRSAGPRGADDAPAAGEGNSKRALDDVLGAARAGVVMTTSMLRCGVGGAGAAATPRRRPTPRRRRAASLRRLERHRRRRRARLPQLRRRRQRRRRARACPAAARRPAVGRPHEPRRPGARRLPRGGGGTSRRAVRQRQQLHCRVATPAAAGAEPLWW